MNIFSKQHTNIFKGIATLMLLFHHLFYKIERFEDCFVWNEKWMSFLNFNALTCKVCVALFLFLSGYGLVKSANSSNKAVTLKFSVLHIVKILLALWLIYIIFVPLGYAFDRTFVDIYGTGISSIKYLLTDLTGTSFLFGYYPKANATWWFFGEIIRLYLLFPLFYGGLKNNSGLTFIVGFLLGWCYGLVWVIPFVLGMIFAEKDFISLIMAQKGYKKFFCVAVNAIFFVIFVLARTKYGLLCDGFIAIGIIGCLAPLINTNKIIGKSLSFIGIHSANIFMFHTFIYSKYMYNFIYGMKYPILIFIVLTLICLIISMLIEQIKKLIRYNKILSFINIKIESIFEKCNMLIQKIWDKNIISKCH